MSKKNKHKFLQKGKNIGKVEKREKGFAQKDGEPLVPPERADRVRMVISPVILPLMPSISCPYLDMPHGIEFRITHGTKPIENQSNKDEFRALHVAADHAGCGWWRLHEFEDIVNYTRRGYIINSGLKFPREYFLGVNFDAIRLQRQLGHHLYEYWRDVKYMLKEMSMRTRLIYELDDVICRGKLPDFNEAKEDFEADEIQDSLHHMLDIVDELFVCSPFMRSIYRKYHQSVDISVLPNFASRGWFDGFYDLERRMRNYEKNKKRPRILISGGATHAHQAGRHIYSKSDYTKVIDAIISARKDFEFVIMGVQPNAFRSFVEDGEMKFQRWVPQLDYPRILNELDIQCSIAPLDDNEFNRAKSSIKWQEACYEGFGFAGQDLEPYAAARHRFTNGSELIDMLKEMTKDEQTYQEEIEYNRKQADNYWIDDKVDDIITLYKTPYGDEKRKDIKWFVDLNPAQFGIPKK